MADAPEATDASRPQPGESIAKRLFSRGATRASVGSRADFYHRLGVDDPYAVESGEGASEGPFQFLSSASYYRDLRRSRLGLISRLSSGDRRIGRMEQRARRIGPAAMATRPSSLARFMSNDAEFELLDDPVLLARAEEEEELAGRWPRTKPRAKRQVGPKPRPMESAVRREVVEVATGVDELQRMIARALQTVRGRQREKLLELLGDVQAAPEQNRRAVVRSAVRKLRGPAATSTRADLLASEEASSRRAAPVAESRGSLTRSKGLRPTLRRSPAILTWLEPQLEEAEEVEQPQVRRRRPTAQAARPVGVRAGRADAAPATATSALVKRILQAESAAADGGTVSMEPTVGIRRAGRRSLAGRVAEAERQAPLARAATGYLREPPKARRSRGFRSRPVEMAFAERELTDEVSEAEVAPRRRPATVRAIERAAPAIAARRAAPGVEAAAPRAPLGRAPVRAATRARRFTRGPVDANGEARSLVPRPVRRRPSAMPTLLAGPADVDEAPTELAGRRPRRRAAAAATPGRPWVEGPTALGSEAVGPRPSRRSRVLDLVSPEAAQLRTQAPTERLMARAFSPPGERLFAAPTSYTSPSRSVLGRSVIDNALFALADDAEAAADESAAMPRPRRRAAAVEAARPVVTRGSASPLLAAQPLIPGRARRAASEAPSVRAARRGVVGSQGDTALTQGRRRRRLAPVPTAYLDAPADEVVASVTGAEGGAGRRLRRAIDQPTAASVPTSRPGERVAERADAPRAVASALRMPTLAAAMDADLSEVSLESPMVRAARRGVVDGSGDALSAEPRRRRRIANVPTSYLDAPSDDVVDSVVGEAPARRRRLDAAPAAAVQQAVSDDADVATEGVAARVAARAEQPAVALERPTVRAARRAADVPQRRRAASVLAVPTAYLAAEADEVVEDAAPLAPSRRRSLSAEAPLLAGPPVPERGVDADVPAARVLRRADPSADVPAPASIEAAVRRGEVPEAVLRRTRGLRTDAMQLVEPETADTAAADTSTVRSRPTVRAVARTQSAPRFDRRGRVLLGTTTPDLPRVGRRRAGTPVPAAPSARMLSRGEAPEAMARRSTVRRPVQSFSLGMVLPELLDALAESEAAEQPLGRRRLGRGTEPSADVPVDASRLGLEEVARRTSNAVRALDRTEQSVLTFDAVRRTFGEDTAARGARRAPTVEARVEVDAQGRVLRVRATRLATGEQVFLQGDDVLPVEASGIAPHRRPAPSEWAEERAAVGMARGSMAGPVVREAPGARLVERSAVPDVRMRSGVGRSIRPLGLDLLAPAAFDVDGAPVDEMSGVPGRRRTPSVPGATVAAGRRGDADVTGQESAPLARRRSRLVPGLGPVTLAAADGTDTSENAASVAAPGRRRRRGPVLPPAGRAAARRSGGDRSLGGTLARLSGPSAMSEGPAPGRIRRRAQPELAWLDSEDADMLDDTVGEAPSWARRAGRPSIGDRKLPDIFSKPRVRTSGGLLTALARAGDPEEVVRVILQRSGDLGDASMLAPAAQRLLHRMVDEAGVVARRTGRSDRAMRGSTTVAPQSKTIVTNMLDPFGPGGFDGSGARSSATSSQGVGASKVMKLANKLMKLIHLAESDGRGDAHKQVRMAENSSEARAEGGAGATSGEQFDDKTMNIKALRQDVLDAVLRALEDLRWRREDPDGPSFWC